MAVWANAAATEAARQKDMSIFMSFIIAQCGEEISAGERNEEKVRDQSERRQCSRMKRSMSS